MIYTDRTITVRKGESKIDEPIVVYRGDYELEVRFTIMNSRFKFMSGTNLIETEKASFGQMAILTPYGGNIFSDIVRCSDGTVTFVLTESMINQIEEIGLYSFQIRLYDYNKESRVSIPPIEYGIEVREPIASEDHDNSVNNAIVGYSIAKVVNPEEENVGDAFDEDGNYNKTQWKTGDRISQGKLNKIEDAIDKINKNEASNTVALSKRIDNNFNVLDSTKADATEVDNVQTQLNNLVLGAVGDGNNAEVVQARGNFNVLNSRLDDFDNLLNTVKEGKFFISVLDDIKLNNGYIKSSDNSIVGWDPNYVYTHMIPISSDDIIRYSVHAQPEVWICSFYDKDKNFISGVSTDGGMYSLSSGVITPPNDAKYVRYCFALSLDRGETQVTDSYIETNVNMISLVDKAFKDIDSLGENFVKTVNLLEGIEMFTGYMDSNGDVIVDSNWVTSDYIQVDKYATVQMHYISHESVAYVTFYDESYNRISYKLGEIRDEECEEYIPIPREAYYIRVSSSSRIYNHYVPLSVTCESNMTLMDIEKEIGELAFIIDDTLKNLTINLLNDMIMGYLGVDGKTEYTGDDHWFYTEYIPVQTNDIVRMYLKGHPLIGTLCLFDDKKNLLECFIASTERGIVEEEVVIQDDGYIRLSGATANYGDYEPEVFITKSASRIELIENDVELLKDIINDLGVDKTDIEYIHPHTIYTTCNDVGPNKGHNRNYSAAVYLDHFFNGFTEEKHIRFGNNSDKVIVYSPIMVTDSNENNPAVMYNECLDILSSTKTYTITGNDIKDNEFSFTHISTLNSATINVTPRVLCIGDSITYGELAQVNDDNHMQNWAYHLMCKELFMKDNIDNGGSGYDVLFLGQYKKNRSMTYKDTTYDVVSHHEGIRGISLSAYLNGSVPAFKSSSSGLFSINAWLSKYRTMDDNGNRLSIGNGTGTLITASNINDIDVCTPTHVLIMLGANGGGSLSDYKKLVDIIKNEYPNMIIGLAIPDCAGTYFPSLHPNCDDKMTIWKDTGSQGSRHSSMYNLVKMLQDEFCTAEYENQNIYVVPFYFTQPTAESCSMRKVNLPCSEIRLTHDNIFNANYGWHASTHVNGIGHINWAYQLYSWLKYTVAKNK